MSRRLLSPEALARALAVRDLTDPAQGRHAMQVLLHDLVSALETSWRCPVELIRGSPIVSVRDNYDALGYPPDCASRDARYTRYVTPDTLLRTQTSAMIPGALRRPRASPDDVLLVVPGLVYRRDCVDRLHTGEPHQVDLWRIGGTASTRELMELVVRSTLPGREWRATPTAHPYTEHGQQLDVRDDDGGWVEIGECGEINRALLGVRGLAMGLGLDRLLMLRKGIPDIRRVRDELLDLSPWKPTSNQPLARRDLSLAIDPSHAEAELLGDRVREALGERAALVEAVEVLSVTPARELSLIARARIGMSPHQVNVLLRLTLRALERTLTTAECNAIRDDVYRALHEGTVTPLT
jgi:phenylalanyl-tRNA synthetase alpha chain